MNKKILLVDDEKDLQNILSKILLTSGYKVICAEDGNMAIKYFEMEKPDLVILDFRLPDINGFEVLEKLKSIQNEVMIIMLTAHGNIKHAVQAMKMGAYDYLTKPFDNDELLLVLEKAFEKLSLRKEVKRLQKKLFEYSDLKNSMGESSAIKKVLEMVDVVAPTDITVLLEGKTGTGKEWIAKLIHRKSERSKKPFIAVDCGAIPESLFESELFGYEKGAFTGAFRSRKGKFELADQGTLFLDEINNLPLGLQAKFLRVLEERSQVRLGSKNPIKVDVRLIVASNREIIEKVGSGNFRDDLFYRLCEFKINIPTLKERIDDIPILTKYFITEANKKFKKKIKGLSDKALMKIFDYRWPGNIREMRNVITRAVLLAKTDYIQPKELEFHIITNSNEQYDDLELSKRLEKVELQTIKTALNFCKGNKSESARKLGISKRQLYRKLEKYNIFDI